MQTVIETQKQRIELSYKEYVALGFLLKLKRILARTKNKVEERVFYFLNRSGSDVTLDTSKTEYKVKYGANLSPCEFTYRGQLVATVIDCANPRTVNLALLETSFPDAYRVCVSIDNGSHLRFNIKK